CKTHPRQRRDTGTSTPSTAKVNTSPTPAIVPSTAAALAPPAWLFFFSSRRRHTRSVSAFLLNRSSDLIGRAVQQVSEIMRQILTSRLSLSKHLAHNLGNLLLLGKIGVFHNRRNASSRLLLLISKHLDRKSVV